MQSNAKQSKAMQSNAKQSNAKQCKTRQSKAKQCKAMNAFKNAFNMFLKKATNPNWCRAGFICQVMTVFPQLGLPIRCSNYVPKQPVGCPGAARARVPRGMLPGRVPPASSAWFPQPQIP